MRVHLYGHQPTRPDFSGYQLHLNGRNLTRYEKDHFLQCVDIIYNQSKHVIFRGDKKKHLRRIYGLRGRWFPNTFNDALFFFGAKSRLFTIPAKIRRRALKITDESRNAFSHLFKMIRELLLNPKTRDQRDVVDTITSKNPSLVSFFLPAENEDRLMELAAALPTPERLRLRDHYLSLLHHIGSGSYYSETFLLSTTESFDKASHFALGGNQEISSVQKSTGIVIMGWVPWGLENTVKALRSVDFRPTSPILNFGLPLYKQLLFPHEREITLKGGLFPHYILGYLHWKRGGEIFEINPAISQVNYDWNGKELPVDQSSWAERIHQTEFGAYFQLHEDQAYSQQELAKRRRPTNFADR
jgi:hypothetical protein